MFPKSPQHWTTGGRGGGTAQELLPVEGGTGPIQPIPCGQSQGGGGAGGPGCYQAAFYR